MVQAIGLSILLAADLPKPQSVPQAARQLLVKDGAKQLAALANLKAVCRGPQRHGFRDAHPIEKALKRLSAKADPTQRAKVLAAVMDASSCFSAARFVPLVAGQLADKDPAVVAYAAETAGAINQPEMLPLLTEALSKRRASCQKKGLSAAEVDACVWLAYAPGAVLPNVPDTAARQQVLELVLPFLEAPYAKLREVTVETAAATKLPAAIEPLEKLIKRERAKGFGQPNSEGLIGRFEKRLKSLKRLKEKG